MAEIQPGHYTQGGCHTAQGDRRVLSSLVCTEGIAPGNGGELAVTAGGGMSVDVASGSAFIDGTLATWQGMYHATNDATVNLAVTAADATNARIDLVVARVYDAAYAGALNEWDLEVIAGTPSPVPVAPTLPDNSLLLATLSVPAGDTVIDAGQITDNRVEYGLCAGVGSQVDVFTSDGTWTKPAGAVSVGVFLVAGGGGAGSGRKGAVGTARFGGGGGGGAGITQVTVDAATLASTEAVVIGQGGPGWAPQTTNSTDGTAGTDGGDTTFGGITATGGAGGAAGSSISAGDGATGGRGTGFGGAGVAAVATATAANVEDYPAGAPGGSAGWSISSGNVTQITGDGGDSWSGAAGGVSGSPGLPGDDSAIQGPGAGGGGGSSVTAPSGGGNGGLYGGGGGGGGAGVDSVRNSGAGGNGADGIAVIITHF